jgi:hypothetical protein
VPSQKNPYHQPPGAVENPPAGNPDEDDMEVDYGGPVVHTATIPRSHRPSYPKTQFCFRGGQGVGQFWQLPGTTFVWWRHALSLATARTELGLVL